MLNKKRKYQYFSVLVIVCLFLGSIFSNPIAVLANNNTNLTASDAEVKVTLEKSSFDYVTQFIAGNFEDFYNASSDQIQKYITVAQLKQGWDEIISTTGKPGNIISSAYTAQKNIITVTERIECAQNDITVTIRYNTESKPIGLNTKIVPKIPQVAHTDKWEEVAVTVGERELNGMLTLPKGVKNPPVVILIQGSGPSDMNETIGTGPNRPFEDIAHGLADRGIATLRYNKSTYQYPNAHAEDFTIQYEVLDDAAAAVELLSKDNRVDANQIYLLGHSLGGMMAPRITADNPKIKGFISMAGSLRLFQDILLDQNIAAINAEPTLTEQQKKDFIAQSKVVLDKAKTLDDGGTNVIANLPTVYWKSLNETNCLKTVKKLKVPMLILQGSADFQVYTDIDYKLWKTTLKKQKNVTYHLYKGLSHLFMTNQESKNNIPDVTVYSAPNHVEKKVIKDIATWVKGHKD